MAGDDRAWIADGAGKCWWRRLRGAPEGPAAHPKKSPRPPGAVSVQETSPDAFGPGVNIVYL